MSRNRLIALIAAGAVVLVGAGITAGILIGRSSRSTAAPSASPPSSGSVTPPSPTALPTTSPTSVGAGAGTVVTPAGALLSAPGGPPLTPGGPSIACGSLISSGFTGTCGIAEMFGGRAIWTVQHHPGPSPCCEEYQVHVFVYSADAGGWYPALQETDPQGFTYFGASVTAADLTHDGRPELVAAFHFQGSGSILAYDIVTWSGTGAPIVAAHPNELSHGSAVVSESGVDEYSAQYPHGEPNCCPPYYRHRRISFDGLVFRAVVVGNVDPNAVPPSNV